MQSAAPDGHPTGAGGQVSVSPYGNITEFCTRFLASRRDEHDAITLC